MKEVRSMICSVSEAFLLLEIHHQLIRVLGDDVMIVRHVRKWCREFENGRTDVRDDDRTGRHITSVTGVNTARVEELSLDN
jgi:hypothetical protein